MDLSPRSLLLAYAHGVFPMADDAGRVDFYDCDPRALLPLDDTFHVPRRLARSMRSGKFEIRFDTAFEQVMRGCAAPAKDREQTWISEEIIAAFTNLHRAGFAHSCEVWFEEELVGGVYGVSLKGLFAGESMFHTKRDASKIALVALIDRLRSNGYVLFDVQYIVTDHLRQFGAFEVPRAEYHRRLAEALTVEARFD